MNVKSFFFATLLFLFAFTAVPALAGNEPGDNEAAKSEMTEQEYKEAVDALKVRVNELKEAKKNAQTKEEKQTLKKEIKDVKKEAKELKELQRGGGFGLYIGGGALLVIILLILLL